MHAYMNKRFAAFACERVFCNAHASSLKLFDKWLRKTKVNRNMSNLHVLGTSAVQCEAWIGCWNQKSERGVRGGEKKCQEWGRVKDFIPLPKHYR